MKEFILNLQFIFKPAYWVMNDRYSKELDAIMNDLLDKYNFEEINKYTAKLGGIEIWITNRPYACMVPSDLIYSGFRPSRLTIKKGINKLGLVFKHQ